MRLLHSWDDEDACRRCAAWLRSQELEAVVDGGEDGARWELWLTRENQRAAAQAAVQEFLAEPAAERFRVGRKNFQRIKRKTESFHESPGGGYLQQGSLVAMGPVTLGLIMLCVAVALVSRAGENHDSLRALTLTTITVEHGRVVAVERSLDAVLGGQVWRLLTPILIHFGPMHLVFNMAALHLYGSVLESRTKGSYLLLLVAILGMASLLAEYGMSLWLHDQAPFVGGFSGVGLGLLGYVWIRGRYDPLSNMRMPRSQLIYGLAWMGLCFTGLLGNIANWAHLSGFLLGCAWAGLDTWLARRRRAA